MTSAPVSVFLGPDHDRWPCTWQDVVDAAAGGLLDETSYVDLKRELSSVGGRAQNNSAIAKDLR